LSFQSDVVIGERGGHRAPPQQSRRGHAEYPSFRYLFSDPARRASALRAFVEATVRGCEPVGRRAHYRRKDAVSMRPLSGSLRVRSRWSAWRKLRAARSFARILVAAPHAFPAFARYGAVAERHRREDRTSWYLEVFSVRPESQRRGFGTRLLEPILERTDREVPVPPRNLRPGQRLALPPFRASSTDRSLRFFAGSHFDHDAALSSAHG
jgi:GNAT superfamily N-acetyltransferase